MPDTFYRQLGQRIRIYRKLAGLTLEQLAERVNLDGHFVGFIERGQAKPSLDSLHRIASALGVRVADLFQFSRGDVEDRKELLRQINDRLKRCPDAQLRLFRGLIEQMFELLGSGRRV